MSSDALAALADDIERRVIPGAPLPPDIKALYANDVQNGYCFIPAAGPAMTFHFPIQAREDAENAWRIITAMAQASDVQAEISREERDGLISLQVKT